MTARDAAAVKTFARRLLPVNRGSWVVDRALASLREGTARLGDGEKSPLDPDRLWKDSTDRGRGRHAHGLTFLADWVGAAPQVAPADAVSLTDLVHRTVLAWDQRFGSSRSTAPEMAFHDETTAQRLLGVIAALDILDLDESRRSDLIDVAARTAAVLSEPDFHSGLNNHGMFQDLALLTWSILVADDPDDSAGDAAWDLATTRLDAYFASCFTSEGVHIENTPTYHVMVSRYLPILAGIFEHAGTSSAQLYASLLTGAELYATHCVTPEGLYPPVSDTQRRRLDTELNLATFPGGEFEFAVTAGARGREPDRRTAVFPASGYAMSRSAWGVEAATYVYFSCAYNADYHKHSDEQSVVLRSCGRDLLCEAGAYGYNWKDPFTKYAYSSAAHNTMLVDGNGLPRTEPAEVRTGELAPLDEMRVVNAEDDLLEVDGTTRRYPGRVWERRLRVMHGAAPADSRLHIRDTLRSEAGAATLRFLWHLGPGLSVVPRPRGAEVFDGTTKVMEIDIRTTADIDVGLVEGREEPALQGWYFPAFGERVPAPVLTVDCWQQDAVLDTEFRLSGFQWGDEGRESLQPLIHAGPPVPAWVPPADTPAGDQAVVMLAPHSSSAARDRHTAELVKAGVAHWYIPGTTQLIAGTRTPDQVVAGLEEIATAVAGIIRKEAARGVEVLVASVGEGFVPGALAALSTGASMIGLDPTLPFDPADPRARRLAAQLDTRAQTGAAACLAFLVTREGEASADRALHFLEPVRPSRSALPALLAADAEDGFSDELRNALEVARGREIRYHVGYDRRARRFFIDLPETQDVAVAVRVFHGKEQRTTMPYTAGSSHTLAYDGLGPHRLRVHVRDAGGQEICAFTTGVIRVR